MKHNKNILSFTKSHSRKTATIKDVLHELLRFKEVKLFVYPSVPDVIISSVVISKLIDRNVRLAVKVKPLIKNSDIKGETIISLGIPLSKNTINVLNKYAKGGYLIGLCSRELRNYGKNIPFLKCIENHEPLATAVWQLFKETYDYLDYILTLSSIFAHNFFKYPKSMIEEMFLSECVSRNILDRVKSLRVAGVNYKPLYKALACSLIPFFFGISGSFVEAEKFLRTRGIVDLSAKLIEHDPAKIKEIVEDLLEVVNKARKNIWKIEDLIGETYSLKKKMFKEISNDVLELAIVLDTIVEMYGLEKSVFLKEQFSSFLKTIGPTYFSIVRKLSKIVNVIQETGLRELEVNGRIMKILPPINMESYPYYILESLLLTAGFIDHEDVFIVDHKRTLLLSYTTIRRVFAEYSCNVLEKFMKKASGEKAYGLTFKTLRDIIECLREV